jgi:hypothetical protein
MTLRRLVMFAAPALLLACGPSNTAELKSDSATVKVTLDPFELTISSAKGELLRSWKGVDGAYGAVGG